MASSRSSSPVAQYPYPTKTNVANFVSIKLSGNNYQLWQKQMRCLIESHDLLGFVDDTLNQPAVMSMEIASNGSMKLEKNQNYPLWRRSDCLVQGWILGSLSEDVLATVVDLNTARDVWTKLKESLGPRSIKEKYLERREGNEISPYPELYKAALRGDWGTAKSILDHDKYAVTAYITTFNNTALHIAVGTGKKSIHVVAKLVELMPISALSLQNDNGDTALGVAAVVGNTAAAMILVNKDPNLLYITDNKGRFPLHTAVEYEHKETLQYLLKATKESSPFQGKSGTMLLCYFINTDLFGMALDLLKRNPRLARTPWNEEKFSPLMVVIAEKASAFPSGSRFNFLESLIYSCVPVKLDNSSNNTNGGDIENPADIPQVPWQMREMVPSICRNYFRSVCQGLQVVLWKTIGLVPHINHIRQKKLGHHQALELVKCLLKETKSSNDENRTEFNKVIKAVHLAASMGIPEVLEEIGDTFPDAIWMPDDNNHCMLELSVICRCENVFNLIYQMSGQTNMVTWLQDSSKNNILHLAGRLAPEHKLNLVSGAALQMQRELQWFKEVEKFVYPGIKDDRNSCNETPAMVFTKEHKTLLMEGEKWMRETANSCSFAATLISTVAFAAAFTVPGGNNDNNGLPIFSKKNAFFIFMISDAISLFTSTTSLLMFLSILTARYTEGDFLYVLPRRLTLGLVTLFLSITSMMITFCATLNLLFGQQKAWIFIPVAALASLPVTSFVTLQFPLVTDLISSSFGRGIFGKQSDRPFYYHPLYMAKGNGANLHH